MEHSQALAASAATNQAHQLDCSFNLPTPIGVRLYQCLSKMFDDIDGGPVSLPHEYQDNADELLAAIEDEKDADLFMQAETLNCDNYLDHLYTLPDLMKYQHAVNAFLPLANFIFLTAR